MEQLVAAFTTLFVIVDPFGLTPIFLSLTLDMERSTRRRIAVQAASIAFLVLAGAALAGDWILRQLGIGLPAFRIAGGLLLFAIAFEMVFERRSDRRAGSSARQAEGDLTVAAVPLAVPLIAGPGAITATILLAAKAAWHPLALGALLAVIAAVTACCLAVFLVASRVERFIGRTGQVVLARLLGVILAALAVQFVADGVAAMR
ncbi:MAG: NAAT family transporter [Alphaproteobacteria bacterium]|nr:NAAT family transporter [Alphaproteobacteria bacterium]